MYVVGGNDRFSEVLRSVERYSFDDNEWSVVSPMMVNRASPGQYLIVYSKITLTYQKPITAVASADGLLYVAGGDQVSY